MNSITNEIRILCISDIHLGHKRNHTHSIIENLNEYLNNDQILSQCDILFIAGDVFDDLLSLPNDDVKLIDIWIASLLKRCIKYNILLRVLEGTPSHDRQQSKRFIINNSIIESVYNKSADLKYINTLAVEYIEKYDMHVLYVPDEWSHSTDSTFTQVKALLQSKNIDFVDVAVMHGLFEHQMPEIKKDHIKHNSDNYLSIVKGPIFIGHIHKSSNFKRIIAQGSFDRLNHAEQEPKGYVSLKLFNDHTYECKFIENKKAKTFLTINCNNLDVQENLSKIDKIVSKLRDDSYVRISSSSTNPIVSNQEIFKKRWQFINWSMHFKDKERVKEISVYEQDKVYESIILNKETIFTLVINKVEMSNPDQRLLDACRQNLIEVLQ